MNRALIVVLFAVTSLVACSPEPAATTTTPAPAAASAPAAAPAAGTITGTIAETMNSGGYTYARLQTGSKDTWIATGELPVKVGDRISAVIDMPMENFNSKTLNRSFPLIYFVADVTRDGATVPAADGAAALALTPSHAPTQAGAAPQVVEPIAPAPGGITIADLLAKRKELSGKAVVVRGKVVKVNNQVMGSNWFHLQDGSGTAKDGTNDLTVTTNATVNVGDIVTISGTLTTDKDFGSGYAYDAIVEKATVTQSKAANN
ncbi:MAG: DNA-binding protein [Acidobacteriota bacterium]|nr:DNA-binding protein [Acidobacteriota bacterium]